MPWREQMLWSHSITIAWISHRKVTIQESHLSTLNKPFSSLVFSRLRSPATAWPRLLSFAWHISTLPTVQEERPHVLTPPRAGAGCGAQMGTPFLWSSKRFKNNEHLQPQSPKQLSETSWHHGAHSHKQSDHALSEWLWNSDLMCRRFSRISCYLSTMTQPDTIPGPLLLAYTNPLA